MSASWRPCAGLSWPFRPAVRPAPGHGYASRWTIKLLCTPSACSAARRCRLCGNSVAILCIGGSRVLLLPEYIPTFENVIPDALSRATNEEDYHLATCLFQLIENRFGQRTVDRFASFQNRLCKRFNSFYADVGLEGVDAFAQDWADERNWANPPWSLLPRLVHFLHDRPHVEAIVLTPERPHALLYGLL